MAPDRDAIRIQPHNDIPREVRIIDNTVWARDAGIVVVRGPGSEAYRQVVRGNSVVAGEPVSPEFAEGNHLVTHHGE